MSEAGALRSWIDELHEVLRIPDETYREDSLRIARERMQALEDWKALALTRGARSDKETR